MGPLLRLPRVDAFLYRFVKRIIAAFVCRRCCRCCVLVIRRLLLLLLLLGLRRIFRGTLLLWWIIIITMTCSSSYLKKQRQALQLVLVAVRDNVDDSKGPPPSVTPWQRRRRRRWWQRREQERDDDCRPNTTAWGDPYGGLGVVHCRHSLCVCVCVCVCLCVCVYTDIGFGKALAVNVEWQWWDCQQRDNLLCVMVVVSVTVGTKDFAACRNIIRMDDVFKGYYIIRLGDYCRKGTLSIWNRHKANQTLEKPPWNDIHSRRIDLTSSQEYHGPENRSMLPWRTGCAPWAIPLLAKAEELVNMLDTVCLQPKAWKNLST